MVDNGENPHNPSFAGKMKEKLAVVKDKLTPGHSSEKPVASTGALTTPTQKQSPMEKMDKVSGRKETPRISKNMRGTGSGGLYETVHGEEEVKAAEEGHHQRIGEKIAHMMPGPPYIQRHKKPSDSVDD